MAVNYQPPSDNIWIGDLPATINQAELHTLFEQYGTVTSCRVLPPKGDGAKACAMVRFVDVEVATWVCDNLNGNIPQGLEEAIICRYANPPGWKESFAAQQAAKGIAKGAVSVVPPPPHAPGGALGGMNGGAAMLADVGKGANRWSPYGEADAGAADGWESGGSWGATPCFGKGKGKGKGAKSPAGSMAGVLSQINDSGLLGGGGHVRDECKVAVKGLPADCTDLDLYKLLSPFGAIAPEGVSLLVDADGTCKGMGFVDFFEPEAAQTAIMALGYFECADGSIIEVAAKP